MSQELLKLRNEMFLDALKHGWHTSGLVAEPYKGTVPATKLDRWFQKLYAPSVSELPGPRLLNHFALGADPEFVFVDMNGRMAAANNFGFKAGLSFGADNNGRLVELRPAPSRSALGVLGSMWLTLRWMLVYHPETAAYTWRSGAYFAQDGLGGHFHVGRKRLDQRSQEIDGLDRLCHLMFMARIFNQEEGRRRYYDARGAARGDQYGRLGDIRLQPHGYEYRTFPSWLDNPWLAYFTLVAGKLVVAMPNIFAPLGADDAGITLERARGWLRLLLAYFAPLDDDARLAHNILHRHGFPQHNNGMDFKQSWGLFVGGPLSNTEGNTVQVFPSSIPSTPKAERVLMEALLDAQVPVGDELLPSWTPTTIPEGYSAVIKLLNTQLLPNLGEFCADLVVHKDAPITIMSHNGNNAFMFPPTLTAAQRERIEKMLEPLPVVFVMESPPGIPGISITTSKVHPLAALLQAKQKLLDMGFLPLWRIKEVKPESLKLWKERSRQSAEAPRTAPKVDFKRSKLVTKIDGLP